MANLVVVSFRLGGTDGVSIEAAKWISAAEHLGHRVTTVAGEGPVDHLVPALAITATVAPVRSDLAALVDDADLVIVENVASLPLNPAARSALYNVLDGRAAVFHHHDLPWQRAHLAHLEGPLDQPRWHHVTINELSRRELAERGIEATTLYNSFECSPPTGDRALTRDRLGLTSQRLVLLPTRAIARKNLEGALRLASRLDAHLWILGPAEDGFDGELERLIAAHGTPTLRGNAIGASIHDAYAASDLVVMSSTWEGFGNPVLESVTHRRPLALNRYPVAEELVAFGFDFFDLDAVHDIAAFLDRPEPARLDRNLAIAVEHFNLADLASRLDVILARALTCSHE